jgi:hypothetical protein
MTAISLIRGDGKVIEPKYLRKPPAGLRDGRVDFDNYNCIPMKVNEQETPVMFYKHKNAGICYYFQWNGQWYSVQDITRDGKTGVDDYLVWKIPVSSVITQLKTK